MSYTSPQALGQLISPIDGSVIATLTLRHVTVKEAPVNTDRKYARSAAMAGNLVRDLASVSFAKTVDSLALVALIKQWRAGVLYYKLGIDLKGMRYQHPHLKLTLTPPSGTAETITAYDCKLSDRSFALDVGGVATDTITLDALGGIDTPNDDHGDPFKPLSFFRTGPATYINTAGSFSTAGDGVARFGVPVWAFSAAKAGLVLEGAGTNLVPNSSAQVDATHWTKNGNATAVNVSNTASSPTIATAFYTTYTGTGSAGMVSDNMAVTAGSVYTFSGWIYSDSTSGKVRVDFLSGAGAFLGSSAVLQVSGAGAWNHVTTTVTAPAGAANAYVYCWQDAGSSGNNCYLTDAQFEPSPFPTSMIRTTNGAASRSPDLAGLTVPHNLLTYSQLFTNAAWLVGGVTVASGATDPTGGTTAFTLTKDANSSRSISQVLTANAVAAPYTASVWVKPNTLSKVTLSIYDSTTSQHLTANAVPVVITLIPGIWQRVSATTATNPGAGDSITLYIYVDDYTQATAGSIYAWEPQLEQASIPGIYVPTTSQALPKPTDATEWPAWMTQNGFVECDLIMPTMADYSGAPTIPALGGSADYKKLRLQSYGTGNASVGAYYDRQHNGASGYVGMAGRGTVVGAPSTSLLDGKKHHARLTWQNYIQANGTRTMPMQLWIDGTLIGTVDVAASYGATSWVAPERLWLSDGSTFATISNLKIGYVAPPIGGINQD